MNYKQKYIEARERASKLRVQNQFDTVSQMMEYIFPELAESEDERIRKALIDGFTVMKESKNCGKTFSDHKIPVVDILAWLEKQVGCELYCPQNHQDSSHPNGCIVLEDFTGGEGFYKVHLDYLNKKQVEEVEEMIRAWNTELKTPNENIKVCIGMALTDVPETRFKSYGVSLKECLAWFEKQKDYVSPQMIEDAYLRGCNDTEKKWLEKQVEHRSCDSIEPKFKDGQWIVWQDKCYKVNCNGCGYELIDTNGLSTSVEYGTVDKNAHLWIIADAKYGDVLTNKVNDSILIFKNIQDNYRFSSYCDYFVNTFRAKQFSQWASSAFIPATKEQRDQLFQKICEAGYEWDEDKKELIKIRKIENSNTADVVNEPKLTKEDIDNLNKISKVIYESGQVQSWYRCERIISAEESDRLCDWLKSLYNKLNLLKMKEIKKTSEWTEEDETMTQCIIRDIEYAKHEHPACASTPYNPYDKEIAWLKSLEKRFK